MWYNKQQDSSSSTTGAFNFRRLRTTYLGPKHSVLLVVNLREPMITFKIRVKPINKVNL